MTNGLVCTCWRMIPNRAGQPRHEAGCMLHHTLRPHDVSPSDALTYTRTVLITYDRDDAPLVRTAIRGFRITTVRLVYEWTPTGGWATTIGPVHGHPIHDDGRLGNRTRSIPPRDHTPDGWPTWLTALAAEHRPTSTITIQETP